MIRRIAFLTNTSPLLAPGRGSAGGVNVYTHELACAMAGHGMHVWVLTPRTDRVVDEIVDVEAGYKVVNVLAGPAAPLPLEEQPRHIGEFSESVTKWLVTSAVDVELLHSHYWIAGWAGVLVKESLGLPLVNSFHTLGRVRDLGRRADEPPTSPMRRLTEEEVIARADRVVAATEFERTDLVEHYAADPARVAVSNPGVDHDIFTPGDRGEARRWLGLGSQPLVLFVGRIQALKGIDIAIRAVEPIAGANLLIVGGPSGQDGPRELAALRAMARQLGMGSRVTFLPAQPHRDIVEFYRAADVLIVPSRSESFGLVAAEAQASGLPVIAANVGGLAHTVADQRSGILVGGHEPLRYTEAIRKVIDHPRLAARLRDGAIEHAVQFSWPQAVDRHLTLYAQVLGL